MKKKQKIKIKLPFHPLCHALPRILSGHPPRFYIYIMVQMNTPPTGLLKMALKNHWNVALKNKSCVSLRKTNWQSKTSD
jgi:hypothetical protein